MSKLIVVTPVKNDGWFVENVIRHTVKWADYVFVADESSDDGSHDIYRNLEKEYGNLKIIYDRPKFDFNGPDSRNYYLDLARSFDGENIIFEIHADEIMSAEILKQENRDKLLESMSVGGALMLPWVNLWKSPFYFRNDKSMWSNAKTWIGYRDDRKVKFEGAVFHGSRAPEAFLKNRVDIDFLQVMHYQFVNLSIERSKQALYQIFERNHHPNKNVEYINKTYAVAFDEREVMLEKLDEKHYKSWLKMGIKIDNEYPKEGFNWRDAEVLKNFKRHGVGKYKNLNIWYIDWEAKRKKAIEMGYKEVPDFEIIDPRDLSTKLAHEFLMRYQIYPFWRIRFYLLLAEKGFERLKRMFGVWAK